MIVDTTRPRTKTSALNLKEVSLSSTMSTMLTAIRKKIQIMIKFLPKKEGLGPIPRAGSKMRKLRKKAKKNSR